MLLCEHVRTVGDSRSCAQRACNEHRFCQLAVGGACSNGRLAMNLDAVRTLRCERNGDGHQLLVFLRDGTLGQSRLIEGFESCERFGCKVSKGGNPGQVRHVEHETLLPTSW